jgi:hypothetical protein
MNRLASLTLGLALASVPLAATAQDFDGSKPLLCSTIETYDCEPGGNCLKGLAQDIDAPQFFFIDFEKGMARTVRASGEERTAEIATRLSDSGELILQGSQLGRAWSVTIGQDDGTMVLAVAGDGIAFVVFGACTPM